MLPNYAVLTDPNFWSWASLLIYLIWLHLQQHRTKGHLVNVLEHDDRVIKQNAEIIDKTQGLGEYISGQTDITIHYEAELARLRESLLELAADCSPLGSIRETSSSNRVFERHSELPKELPSDVRSGYLSASWTCPQCGSHIGHNWIWWCKVCQRRTFPPIANKEKPK